MAVNYTSARFSAEDDNGRPLSGGRLFTYQNGTTTPAVTYKDAAGTTPNTNPIILDARGEAVVHLADTQVYTFVLQNRAGGLVWSQDGVTGSASVIDLDAFRSVFDAYKSDLAGEGGSQLVGYQRMQDGSPIPVDGTQLLPLQLKMKDVPISLQEFGAVGDWNPLTDTGTDNFARLQDWMNALCTEERDGFIPPGNFGTAQTVVKPQSFFCPNIRGANGVATTITGPADRPAIKIKGGSGRDAQGVIRDFTVESKSGTGYGIEVADQCGVNFHEVCFGRSQIGLLLHNENGFTEHVVGHNCVFTSETRTALGYKRTNGTDSFHGSGLIDYKISERVGETEHKIVIGGGLSIGGVALPYSDNIIVYNAPLSGQAWRNSNKPFIGNNSVRLNTDFKGTLTFESFVGLPFDIVAGSPVYYLGRLMDLTNVAQRGSLMFARTYASRADGSSAVQLEPYRIPLQLPPSGNVPIAVLGLGLTGTTYEVIVECIGNYPPSPVKVYQLRVYINNNGTAVMNIKPDGSPSFQLFPGDMPFPTFSMAGNALVMTSVFAGTVYASVSVSQIGFSSLNAI